MGRAQAEQEKKQPAIGTGEGDAMSKARDRFKARCKFIMAANYRETANKDSVYFDYILELEQEKAELFNALKKICETLKKHDCRSYNCEACYYDKLIKHTEAQNG